MTICSILTNRVTAAPTVMASVPSNGIIVLTEYGYRNWGPELVHYQIDTKTFQPGKLVLLDSGGTAIPFQINGNVLSFVAALMKNQAVTYTLHSSDTDRSGENSTVSSQVVGDTLEIGNDKFTLRVPRVQSRAFSTSTDTRQVPAPLLGIKHAGRGWYGGSYFVTERKLSSYSFSLIENGKASISYEARYKFAPVGEYVCRIEISHTLPYPLFTEEFDFGEITEGHDFLVLDLSTGWTPETYRWMRSDQGGGAEGPKLNGQISSGTISSYLTTKIKDWNNLPALMPKPHQPGSPSLVLFDRISLAGAYGMKAAVGLSNPSQSVYFLPMHGGIWRRGMAVTAWHDPTEGVKIALPIGVRLFQDFTDLSSDRNPYNTGTHDPLLPQTYGRRTWALCCELADDEVYNIHQRAGLIGLDRYKNWVIDWDYDAAKTFPRAQTTPALAQRLKKSLNNHPEKDRLQKCYIITGNAAHATANAHAALKELRTPNAYITSFENNWGWTSYRDFDFSAWVIFAEDALSCPSLATPLRNELRRRLALFAHFFSEPDMV